MNLSDSTSIMVAPPDINDTSICSSVRDRLGIAPGEIVIVAPGRVSRISGHRFAVWACSILKIADLPVRLIIQNTGRYARNIAEFARMTGFGKQLILAGAEWSVSDFLSAADVALLPNPDDLPTEAMPAGLPIVAADTPETRNRFANEKNALLERPDNPRQIARALLKIIEDRPPATVNDK